MINRYMDGWMDGWMGRYIFPAYITQPEFEFDIDLKSVFMASENMHTK
jgi:hypothetical protein